MAIAYGLPYQGSKNAIAKEILDLLPEGKRLVDLFGGGGAITHCASIEYPYKWKSILYNELNPLVVNLFKDSINGKYTYENNPPRWIDRHEFKEKNESDGYIRYVWSFSNIGETYLYGAHREELKRALHHAIVYKDFRMTDLFGIDLHSIEDIESPRDRRLEVIKISRQHPKLTYTDTKISHLERFERLSNMQHLTAYERCENLSLLPHATIEVTQGSYEDYQYQDGDVVYCDIPYEGSDCRGYVGFDHKKFYDWAYEQPYQVFFSSYDISDGRFKLVWKKEIPIKTSAYSNNIRRVEKLYSNR